MGKGVAGRIILVGFSATGKTRVAKELATLLCWDAVDTDEEIVKETGRSIPQIFAGQGEESFRVLERHILARACEKSGVVIATGGGAVLDPRNRDLMKRSGMVVRLEANPQTIFRRLKEEIESPDSIRPLLSAPDPLERITQLKSSRESDYAIADWTVHTDNLTTAEVCQEIVRARYFWLRSLQDGDGLWGDGELAAEVVTSNGGYPVYVGWETLPGLGSRMSVVGLGGNAYIVSDETVWAIYGEKVIAGLRESGVFTGHFVIPPGEPGKTLEMAAKLYDWLVDSRAERDDCVVALGGGVVGDLAGFVAATFLRGMPLIQVPTSLIAMVDAAVGGKTAVNHAEAKNLVGAFHQPRFVLCDVQTLTTLPPRERISGWAEVIKHGAILDQALFDYLDENAHRLLDMKPAAAMEAIRRSVRVKAAIVSEDEKEKGRRTLLNYGHTIGHALEVATGYGHFLHGEAVSIGMMGAAMLSREMGLITTESVDRQRTLLERFGLPVGCSGVTADTVLKAIELDKKVRRGSVRWVLLEGIGRGTIRSDVPDEKVAGVLAELLDS